MTNVQAVGYPATQDTNLHYCQSNTDADMLQPCKRVNRTVKRQQLAHQVHSSVMVLQVEQAAADVKLREAAVAKREADLSRQEAATLSGNAEAMKREAEVAAREQALAAQLAEVKAAETQLQEKKLEAKELQVVPFDMTLLKTS